jgi:hypothetical protein
LSQFQEQLAERWQFKLNLSIQITIIFFGSAAQRGLWPPRHTRFLDHTQRRATVGRTPLEEWPARRRDLYMTTHNRKHPCPRWDLNPRSQQTSGHIPTP